MTQKHLGENLHDLLDGRMSTADAAEAMAHLEECDDCNARWTELREAREALNTSSAGIDMRFAQQLLDRDRMAQIAQGESKHRARAARARPSRHRSATIAFSILIFAAVGVGAAYYAGGPDQVPLEFAAASAEGTAPNVAYMGPQDMRSADNMRAWVHPDWQDSGLVPIEARVVRGDSGAHMLVASLLAGIDPVVVTEQHGDLVHERVADLPRADVPGIDVYIVRLEPAQLVWQTGDVVVSVSCSCAMVTLETVAGTFPTNTEPGFLDRVHAGLGAFAGTLTGN
ncbi:anti-sigma factor family protein [Demequina oxidasica]|uniref:anti-sigma factor family protein n=1 Tax=Demequina oxidasica TaxID=676199 RepID=UPI00078501D3|nr:zf-HC2 domain-containing protein [Demequina oxidasica]